MSDLASPAALAAESWMSSRAHPLEGRPKSGAPPRPVSVVMSHSRLTDGPEGVGMTWDDPDR